MIVWPCTECHELYSEALACFILGLQHDLINNKRSSDDALDATVHRLQGGASGLPDVLPDRRLLRAVLRGRDCRLARAATGAYGKGQREKAADVRRALSRGRTVHSASVTEGLPDRHVRADRRSEADEKA